MSSAPARRRGSVCDASSAIASRGSERRQAVETGGQEQDHKGRGTTGKEGKMRRVLILAVLVGVGATVWASYGTAAGKEVGKSAATSSLTIVNVQGTTWTCGFNPYDPNVILLSFGTVYEELTFENALKSGQTTPWLASS